MCGSFAYIASYETLKYQFNSANTVEITPRFNIAPGTDVLWLIQPMLMKCPLFYCTGRVSTLVNTADFDHPVAIEPLLE